MAKENVVITSTKDGKTLQKTLTDVNPAATNAQLATFGTMLNALTTNTYGKTDRITKVNCDTEPDGGSSSVTKQTPTLTFSQNITLNNIAGMDAANGTSVTVTRSGDGQLYIRPGTATGYWYQVYDGGFYLRKESSATAGTMYVGLSETENYQGVEVQMNIVISPVTPD